MNRGAEECANRWHEERLMIRFEKILIPTDFSELASHALRYACNLARTYRADLHALHVVVRASEEFDPDENTALGNYPQAYSHVGLINAAICLSAANKQG